MHWRSDDVTIRAATSLVKLLKGLYLETAAFVYEGEHETAFLGDHAQPIFAKAIPTSSTVQRDTGVGRAGMVRRSCACGGVPVTVEGLVCGLAHLLPTFAACLRIHLVTGQPTVQVTFKALEVDNNFGRS